MPNDKISELDLQPEDSEKLQRFRDAPAWELGYWQKGGWAPRAGYEIMLDQAGNYYFDGLGGTPVSGMHELKTNPDEVKALYDNLLDLGFLRLRDRYESVADRCLVHTEGTTLVMRMTIPEEDKPLTYYTGCRIGGPAAEAIDAIATAFATFPPIQRLSGHGERVCKHEHALVHEVEALRDESNEPLRFVLTATEGSSTDKAIGVLELGTLPGTDGYGHELTISDCQGKVLSKSTKVDKHTCGVSVFSEASEKLAWPSVELDVHAAFIGIENVERDSADDVYDVRLLNIEREVLLHARRGQGHCQN